MPSEVGALDRSISQSGNVNDIHKDTKKNWNGRTLQLKIGQQDFTDLNYFYQAAQTKVGKYVEPKPCCHNIKSVETLKGYGLMRVFDTPKSSGETPSRYANEMIKPGHALVHVVGNGKDAELFIESVSRPDDSWNRWSLIHTSFNNKRNLPVSENMNWLDFMKNISTGNSMPRESIVNADDGAFCHDSGSVKDVINFADTLLVSKNEYKTYEITNEQLTQLTNHLYEQDSYSIDRVKKAYIDAYFSNNVAVDKKTGEPYASNDKKLQGKIGNFFQSTRAIFSEISSGQRSLDRQTLDLLGDKALKSMPTLDHLKRPFDLATEISDSDKTTALVKSRYTDTTIKPGYALVHLMCKDGATHTDMIIESNSRPSNQWNRYSLIHASLGIEFPSLRERDINNLTEIFNKNPRAGLLSWNETVINADNGAFCNEEGSTLSAISYADRHMMSGNEYLTIEVPEEKVNHLTSYLKNKNHLDEMQESLPIYNLSTGKLSDVQLKSFIYKYNKEIKKVELKNSNLSKELAVNQNKVLEEKNKGK